MESSQSLSVYGSTGTIGQNTLKLVDEFPGKFQVDVLTAGNNIELLCSQISRYLPRAVCVADGSALERLHQRFPELELYSGSSGLVEITRAFETDRTIMGIVGFAALAPTLEAARLGRTIGLANKESLVVAGLLLLDVAKSSGARVIPVDSEHSALFQLLQDRSRDEVASVVLTASGGPLLKMPEVDLRSVTPEIATKHPNWKMGPKISVDSATMFNKGLEVIEASVLFDLPEDRIEIWVHPQSIVHGAIWLSDNSCLTQLSSVDMRGAIGYALTAPARLGSPVPKLSLAQIARLEFFEPDPARFPALALARQALRSGQSHVIALNAANEIAVERFLNRQLRFDQITTFVQRVLDIHSPVPVNELADVFEIDRRTRQKCTSNLDALA